MALSLAVVAALASCALVTDTKVVTAEARAYIVGQASVVHEAETWTQGRTSYQNLLLVLDFGLPDELAVREESKRLGSLGWSVSEQKSYGTVAYSDEVNATAAIDTLQGYLARSAPGHEQIDTAIRQKFADDSKLIIVSVEPRT